MGLTSGSDVGWGEVGMKKILEIIDFSIFLFSIFQNLKYSKSTTNEKKEPAISTNNY